MSPLVGVEHAPAKAGRQGVSSPVPTGIAEGDAKRRALLAASRSAGLQGVLEPSPRSDGLRGERERVWQSVLFGLRSRQRRAVLLAARQLSVSTAFSPLALRSY